MTWKELLTPKDLDLVTGIESTLRGRRRAGSAVILLTLVLQVALTVSKSDYLQKVSGFLGRLVLGPRQDLTAGIKAYEVIGLVLLVAGLAVFVLARWSRVLLRETGEPFRYTFWIEAFKPVPDAEASARPLARLDLLQYDLRERLNFRIRRLSLLNDTVNHLSESQRRGLIAHVHIAGEYSTRARLSARGEVDQIAIRIMPRVRIGPAGQPETLTAPVEIIVPQPARSSDDGAAPLELDAATYERAVERTYSRIAHEIYRRIKADLGDKITLFPTSYLRAVALFHEAKDFERSNTIDAYDYALDLYREANRYFDTRLLGPLHRRLAGMPAVWFLVRKSLLMEARTKIGYARCLIYRRAISALSGRSQNPLFVIPRNIDAVIRRLESAHQRLVERPLRVEEIPTGDPGSAAIQAVLRRNRFNQLLVFLTFPGDTPTRRLEKLSERLRETLFEAYAVGALGHAYLGAVQRAKNYVDNARAIAPRMTEDHAVWLLAAAECEFDIDVKLHFLERAAEQDPEFEIALYRRAFLTEMRLRDRNEMQPERLAQAIDHYEHSLKINPGNIGALAATGYLYWLSGNLARARQRYAEGLDVKAIVSQTFVGDLSYGLARVVAEEGNQPLAYELFAQALSADPAVGAFSKGSYTKQVSAFFEYIGDDMLERFERYRSTVVGSIGDALLLAGDPRAALEGERAEKTRQAVLSFILNDCGNAYLNSFYRTGDDHHLDRAVRYFEAAIRLQPDLSAAYYNLDHAYTWLGRFENRIENCLEMAQKLAPGWPTVTIEAARSLLERARGALDSATYTVEWKRKQLVEKTTAHVETGQLLELARAQASKAAAHGTEPPGLKVPLGPAAQAPDPDLPGRLKRRMEQITQEIADLDKQLAEAESELARQRPGLATAAGEGLTRIAVDTKLSYLFAYKKPAEVVDVLIDSAIQWERLDENDVDALITLAEFLSQSPGDESLLQAAERFAHYVLDHYPENFEAYRCLERVVVHRIKACENGSPPASAPEPLLQARGEYRSHLERILRGRLTTDLNRCVIVHEAVVLLDSDELIQGFLRTQADYAEHKDLYHHLLGRSYIQRFRLNEAAEQYKAAVRTAPDRASHHAGLGMVYVRRRNWPQAIRSFRTACALAPRRQDYQVTLGQCCHGAGQEHLDRQQVDKAIENLHLAIQADAGNAEYHASLAAAWEAMAARQGVASLSLAATAMRKAWELAPRNAKYQERARRLQRALDLSSRYGEEILEMKAELEPIVIEVGRGLEAFVWSGQGDGHVVELWFVIPDFQRTIMEMTGLEAPPIVFRRSPGLPPRGYRFLLWGVPAEHGDVPERKRLLRQGLDSLLEIGVAGEKVDPAFWWISGLCWFSQEDLAKVEQAGVGVWDWLDPLWLHFGNFIRRHMIDLIDHESLWRTLQASKGTITSRIAESPEMVSGLVHVLRMLAMERVPIVAMPEVCERFAELHAEAVDPILMVERLRQLPAIREKLPGNEKLSANPEVPLIQLSEEFEKLVEKSIHREGAGSVLAMEPGLCQEALRAIRDEVQKGPDMMALLVNNGEIRPFVRRLVELEFPYFWVLSRPEVQGEGDDSVVAKRIIADRVVRLSTEAGVK